ncbi:MAG: universal stress protein [Anaerolinea sp.]|nr:universal stress protein [Anaerolinea sp.]
MDSNDLVYSAVLRDFQEARRRAALEDLKARLTGKSDDLLSYEEVQALVLPDESTSRGLQEIPLDAIVGSVGRYRDFTRSFLPRLESNKHRWANVKLRALYRGGVSPIEVYQLGDVYFVLDGNHRVSVARQLGAETIQAYVTQVHSRVPLSADVHPDELIIKTRYARFLDATALDQSRPGLNLLVTAPGQYRKLEEQIEAFRRRLAQREGRALSGPEAAAAWYDAVYLPVAQIIRERDLLSLFAGHTETDLFIWVLDRQEAVEEEIGWAVTPQRIAGELVPSRRRRSEDEPEEVAPDDDAPAALELAVEHLFPDILVPISGSPRGWLALDQALVVAQREGSALHGFHLVRSRSESDRQRAGRVQEEFDRRCQAAGVVGQLVIEVGPVARTICQRARWTDLVVANLAFPPTRSLPGKLQSGFRALVHHCTRPVLAVPRVSPLSRALLAYDGSPRAREALFIAAYLAGRWRIPLAVVTVVEPGRAGAATLDAARAYLETHAVEACYLEVQGPVAPAILQAAADQQADLLVMGGYGYSPMWEAMLGSAVDHLLRECQQPMLICK